MGVHVTTALEDLIISEPGLQVGLTDIIPLGEIPAHYINRYHAAEKVRCAFCDKHTPHNKGFTAQMADGRIALCGRDCAAKYFGQEVADKFEEQLEKQIERSSRRLLIQRTLDGIPDTLAQVSEDLVRMEQAGLKAAHALFLEFRSARLPTRLTEAGDLEISENRRRWVEREDENGQVRKVPIDEARVVLRVEAARILKLGDFVPSHFDAARRELALLASVKSTDAWSDTVIDRMVKKRSKVMDDIRHGTRFMSMCRRFFTKDNIKSVSALAQQYDTPAEKIGLHKVPGVGWDLLITSRPFSFHFDQSPEGKTRRYRLPDFEAAPSADDLLTALKTGL